ncbi:hypothetical protein [Bremerella sp.]|uniref:hypothetical protein n=1 Tax=Bremerella sp. TaxID=2795602 RepID=UPI00391A7F86
MGLNSDPFGKKDEPSGPPVPDWEPAIAVPHERIIDRFRYYTDDSQDFVVFQHGTCAIVPRSAPEEECAAKAKETLHAIFNYHPDMNPTWMDDGNILVRYNHPAYNIVLDDIATANWDTLNENHLRGLATDEVLITPMGHNKFDEFGIKALFGRCYFFMDAKNPVVHSVVRGQSDS